MPKIVIAGNWKMYKTQSEAKAFFSEFPNHLKDTASQAAITDQQILICVPYTNLALLQTVVPAICPNLNIGAQNVHWAENGAFTGEISAPMLVELGIKYVIIGHSERRQFFGETDETVNKRLKAAQAHGLTPILCVGESKQQRDANETESWIFSQLAADLVEVDQNNLIIAYEPIWAIGTGDTCASSEANRVIGLIRGKLANRDITIQYGGSVKADNIDEIMAQPEIDGVLVGGASLDPAGFARIVNYR
ncbi:triose-phosphate isomerase [Pseudanabaena sp. SR411]|uniref:triose-phosphate isomerase n=1 Tax=Pseudanabaena sp. SR411 TaxID=1980935 RepID=UPI000B992F9A|nr:triose-phosphate isomerase [Pseudanabaena sp. SR411]OYQ61740.1 triose-phosphate isomerase [Pseudanabaena sp. SR411]